MTNHEPSAARSPFPQEIAGSDMMLTLTPGQVYVEFADTLSSPEINAFIDQYRLQPVEGASSVAPYKDVGEMPLRERRLQWPTGEDTARFISELRADDRVRTASPLYHRADRLPADTATSFSDQVLVHFGAGASEEEINALIAASDTEIVAAEPFVQAGVVYQLRLRRPKQQDIFAIVDAFARSPLVRYAGPDWIQMQSPASTMTPNDAQFGNQWNLHKIEAPRGWYYTLGSRRVVIAIIDSGCELNHPDLVGKYVPAADHFDVLEKKGIPNPANGDNHGTACAGVAAAQTDNIIGVAGVAPKCSIMPIRLFVNKSDSYRVGICSQVDIKRAIDFARMHGADVINMSWHYDDAPHELADIALIEAYDANIVLVAAAGNCFKKDGCTDPTFIQYPASHRAVMAVGGSDEKDQRQKPPISKPEKPEKQGSTKDWDSRYGSKLSVVAPGIDCPTTNLGGGYMKDFYGTSASAPHVAGLAALLMSFHPAPNVNRLDVVSAYRDNWPRNGLTNYWVSRIIEESADKVGGFTYAKDPLHPHGSWNLEMGYGRINVVRALVRARDILGRSMRFYSVVNEILFGLVSGGSGVVLPPGGPPVPVDPGWLYLSPEKRDVLLSLAITELAEGVNDREAQLALRRTGWNAIERTAQRMGQDS